MPVDSGPLPGWAAALELEPHPEGGWYRETYRAALRLPAATLPCGYVGDRAAGTAILYLLPALGRSRWHAVRSDELWLWHRGGPLQLTLGGDDATAPDEVERRVLGQDVGAGQVVTTTVPGGHWQRATAGYEAALVSCVVVPGFDFADFRLTEGPDG